MSFVTEYPAWFVLLCALLGGVYAFIFYFRTGKEEINPWLTRTMILFRFLSVTIISFLLLSPLIKKKSEIVEKPVIIIAQDNSLSVALNKDSAYFKKKFPADLEKLTLELGKKYDIAFLSFGERIERGLRTDFTGHQTNISSVFEEINSRFINRNIGALILSTDGIYNQGANPFYAAEKITFPVYTIALGDTTIFRDIILKKINYNKTAFVGDRFPVEVMIEGNKTQGEKTEVQLREGDKVISSVPVTFPAERSFQKVTFLPETKEKGLKRYSIIVVPVKGEISTLNNRQDIFVEISDSRQKIAFIYASPHPDIAALRNALGSASKFEIEDFKVDEFNQSPDKYDLIILCQLPSLTGYSNLSKFMTSSVSLLFLIGSQTNLDEFNGLKSGLTITSSKNNYVETNPSVNNDFALFTIGNTIPEMLSKVPPLISPFGNYQYSPAADVLLFQQIGSVRSRSPQILFIQSSGKKIGVIAGENIWKWRLSDYLQHENHLAFDELTDKIVQFLAVKGDKSFLRIRVNNRFMENENVEMDAEVYNESYELINDPEVNITITDEQGKKFPFVFGKTDKAYHLNAGSFPVGSYTFSADVKVGKNIYRKNGNFFVAPVNLEAMNTIADHNLLYRISRAHDGKMVFPSNMQDLVKMINDREDIKPVSYIQKRYNDLVGNVVVFLLILGLLSAEWFIRKRSGKY